MVTEDADGTACYAHFILTDAGVATQIVCIGHRNIQRHKHLQ